MSKISLLTKFKILREQKRWLKKVHEQTLENYEIDVYAYVQGSFLERIARRMCGEFSICMLDKDKEFSEVVEISKKQKIVVEKPEGIYIFGTEGVFFKKEANGTLEQIMEKNQGGLGVDPEIRVVIANVQDSKLVIGRFENGRLTKRLEFNSFCYYSYKIMGYVMNDLWVINLNDVKCLLKKEQEYVYCYLKEDGIYTNLDEEIMFDDKNEILRLCNGQIAKAYDYAKQIDVLVSLVNNKIEKQFKVVGNYQVFLDEYCFAEKKNTNEMHVMIKQKNGGYTKSYIIPKGYYVYIGSFCDVRIFKMHYLEGILLVLIYGNKVVRKIYPNAISLKISQPHIQDDENLLFIKPIVEYRK